MQTILIISVILHLISFSLMLAAAIGLTRAKLLYQKGMGGVGKLSKLLSTQLSELILRNASEKDT